MIEKLFVSHQNTATVNWQLLSALKIQVPRLVIFYYCLSVLRGDVLLNRESNRRQTFFRSLRANYFSVPKCTIDIPLCFDIQANHREKLVMSTVNNTSGRRRNSIQKHFQPHKVQEVEESWSYDLLHGKLFLFDEFREGNTNTNLNNFILPCCLLCVPQEYLQPT